jgi:hypothetical protein
MLSSVGHMSDRQPLSERGAALRAEGDYDAAIAVLRSAVEAGEADAPRLLATSFIQVNDRGARRSGAGCAGRPRRLATLLGNVVDELG